MKPSIKQLFLILLLLVAALPLSAGNTGPSGIDLSGRLTYDNGKPIRGAAVSDGYCVVATDEQGFYRIESTPEARFVYVSLPADCRVPIGKNGMPLFWQSIDPSQPDARYDFRFEKIPVERSFTLYCLADPQVKSAAHLERLCQETVPDLIESIKNSKANYAVTLGDNIYDRPQLIPDLQKALGELAMPVFMTMGNHDHLETEIGDRAARANFENHFGPVDYSFNRGNAHIVVMDNVQYLKKQKYRSELTSAQLEWLKQDLARVPSDKTVLLCVHIPLRTTAHKAGADNRYDELLELLSRFDEAHIMSGHTHYNQNFLHETASGKTIYEHIHGAVCGAWWSSTICTDGTPNGYGVYRFNAKGIRDWHYKGTLLPAEVQARFYPVGSFPGSLAEERPGEIVVNVWNADDTWKVELLEDGKKSCDMERFTDYDKAVWQHAKELGKPVPKDADHPTHWFHKNDHLYRGVPRSADSQITIRITDRFGKVYLQEVPTTDTRSMKSYPEK